MTCSDGMSLGRDSPLAESCLKDARGLQRVDVVWTCAGAALGFALSLTAAQAAVALILAAALFLVSLRSSLAGLSAILCAIVFSTRVDVFGHWIYSLHFVVSVVFAALLLQIARRSNGSPEIRAVAGTLGVLALVTRFAEAERWSAAGFDVAFGSQLCFLALLPRFFYTLWRETSQAFAWCSSVFFLLFAVAAVVTGLTPYSWSLPPLRSVVGMAAIAAACLRADQTWLLLWLLGLLAERRCDAGSCRALRPCPRRFVSGGCVYARFGHVRPTQSFWGVPRDGGCGDVWPVASRTGKGGKGCRRDAVPAVLGSLRHLVAGSDRGPASPPFWLCRCLLGGARVPDEAASAWRS